MRGERGSVSVVVAGLVALVLAASLATADLVRALSAVARAQTAADAAALAAAQEVALPSGREPEEVAAEYAARNGAALEACRCEAGTFEASVGVRLPVGRLLLLGGGRTARAEARAVVDVPSG